jgi:hypothetical protein
MPGRSLLLSLLIVLTAFGGISWVGAQAIAGAAGDGRVPMPVIARGKGDSCVAETDFMRRNHMTVLLHQRDETVHEGIRTKQFSLKECIACHVVAGLDGTPVSAASPAHFCRGCHDYAAVSIDCFECHSSRPGSTAMTDEQPLRVSDNAASLRPAAAQ